METVEVVNVLDEIIAECGIFELITCDFCGNHITQDNPVKIEIKTNFLNTPKEKSKYEICGECLTKVNNLMQNDNSK